MNLYPDSALCPICLQTSRQGQHGTEWLSVSCPNCGKFIITDDTKFEAEAKIGKDEQKRALASHAIRNLSARGTQVKVYSSDIDEFLKGSPPSVMEQANNLLNHFAATAKEPGNTIRFTHPEEFTGVTGALSKEGVTALFEFLCESNFLKKQDSNLNAYAYSMTVKGWQHYEELSKQAKDSTKAFMAMKFGEPELDAIVDDIFRPAVLETGFRLQKLTDDQQAGLIDDQIRVQIRRSRFLIADLTHANNGAYWEAGFAEGIGIPVIYTCKQEIFDDEKRKPHFDTNHHLIVMWDTGKSEEAAKKLKATIRATLPESAKMEDD